MDPPKKAEAVKKEKAPPALQDDQGASRLRGPHRRLHVGRREQGRQGQGEGQGLLPRQAEGASQKAEPKK